MARVQPAKPFHSIRPPWNRWRNSRVLQPGEGGGAAPPGTWGRLAWETCWPRGAPSLREPPC